MSHLKNLAGQKFGYLTVTNRDYLSKRTRWYCQCDCGNIKSILSTHLLSEAINSCGCKKGYLISKHNTKKPVLEKIDELTVALIIGDIKVLCDTDDIDLITQCSWGLNDSNYAVGVIDGKLAYLHRAIMGRRFMMSQNNQIDHINGDIHDCRKVNLRIVTHKENAINKSLQTRNQYGHKGIYKRKNKWYAQITKDNITHCLGTFTSKDDAIIAREDAEREFFGEFNRSKKYEHNKVSRR